jgi:hypothetical protein
MGGGAVCWTAGVERSRVGQLATEASGRGEGVARHRLNGSVFERLICVQPTVPALMSDSSARRMPHEERMTQDA